MIGKFSLRRYSRVATMLLALAMPGIVASLAVAQLGFDLQISESELLLAHEGNPVWEAALEYDNGFTRMFHRNMPTIELTNSSIAGSPDIERFELTIGDNRFNFTDDHFGDFAILGMTTPGFILDPEISDAGNRLIVNISKQGGGGLPVGELVRFRFQLGVDAGFDFFDYPDFRTVLFDMNGCEVYDGNTGCGTLVNGDNAVASITFENGAGVGPVVIPDVVVNGNAGLFFNNNFPVHSTNQNIDIFDLGDPGVIPEPASAFLAFAGLASGLMLRTRTRRRTGSQTRHRIAI